MLENILLVRPFNRNQIKPTENNHLRNRMYLFALCLCLSVFLSQQFEIHSLRKFSSVIFRLCACTQIMLELKSDQFSRFRSAFEGTLNRWSRITTHKRMWLYLCIRKRMILAIVIYTLRLLHSGLKYIIRSHWPAW